MERKSELTKALLGEKFKELVAKKGFEKLTIKMITDAAGVIRPTFYNYFQDKYEVVEYIFTHEVLEPMRPFLQSGLVKEAFHFMIVTIQKDSEFYRREIMRSSQNSFRDILAGACTIFFFPLSKKRFKTEASVSDCGKYHRILY